MLSRSLHYRPLMRGDDYHVYKRGILDGKGCSSNGFVEANESNAATEQERTSSSKP